MNDLRYIYDFNGQLEIVFEDKLFKIKNKRIISDIEKIIVNNEVYYGEELNDYDVIDIKSERIVYFTKFLISSFIIDLNELKLNYQTIKDREIFNRKYNDKEIKPKLEINLNKVNLLPLNRNVSIISFMPMVMMSLASLSVVIINIYQKTNSFSFRDNISQLLLPIVMLISTLILQPLIRVQEKQRTNKENRKRINDYKKYLSKKDEAVKYFKRQNDNYLNNIYLDQDILNDMISFENVYRYIKEEDGFLTLSLGRGLIELDNFKIKNNNNEENEIGDLSKEFIIKNTKANSGPIILDLKTEEYPTFVVKEKDFNYIDFILMSIFITIHPSDLKVSALINEQYQKRFDYLSNIKHFIYDSINHIYKVDERQYKDADLLIVIGKNYSPKVTAKQKVITIVEDEKDIPAYTKVLITIKNDSGIIKRKESITEFHFKKKEINIKDFIKLSNKYSYPKDINKTEIIPLTDLYPFEYSPSTLKAVLGKNQQGLVTLDLDETKDGPHGLVCGMTGSGKSELLLTFVLSLSLNYSPNYVCFVIVDFKGGGIVNILNNKERKLKHLVGSLTNIDSINFERILVSFRNEIVRRQTIFKEASEKSGENITNIKEYQTLLKRGVVTKPLPHLIIILDEFAEIKKEHNEVIEEFLSISRVGRSLGIHLILATQRAQGVIDDEIKSNAGFKICLKVNSKEDSREVIETEDAVEIKEKGGFYLLTNSNYIYGKSAYTNADINKSYLKKTELLDQNLESIDKIFSKTSTKSITEATKIIDVLNKKYQAINLDDQRLWLDPLKDLKRNNSSNTNEYCFGVIDDYRNKKQYPACFSYLTNNLVISIDKNKKEQNLINCLNDLRNKDIDVYLVNLSKYKFKTKNIVEISEKKNYELSYLLNLIENGKERFKRNVLIVITDLKSFQSINEYTSEILKKAIEQSENYNYKFLIYANTSADYTYSFSLLFEHLAYLGDYKSDEVINIFSKNYRSESINDGLIEINELKEFKLYEEDLINSDKQIDSLIKYIPSKRYLTKDNNKYLLGYDVKFAEEFYLDLSGNKKVIITSYDDEIITYLKEIIINNNVSFVNAAELRSFKREIRTSHILFFGSGLIDNYDLNSGIREDLEDDEMMYIYQKEKIRIKYFNKNL